MDYDEIINSIQSKCKKNIFGELDEFLTNLDDDMVDIIELENKKFRIKKNIISTNFENGTVKCRYMLDIVL